MSLISSKAKSVSVRFPMLVIIHFVAKNGNCTCLETFSGQAWQFYMATDI